jgi:hypothetical protein
MKTRLLVASSLPILMLCAATARAQTLDVTLVDPNQTVTQGTTSIAVDATIFNPTTQTIYLNGDSSTTSSPFLTVDDTPFFNNAPLSLAPGQSSGTIELFDVDLAGATPTGTYALNTFSILGGADGGTFSLFNDLADAQFSVTVSSAVSVSAPEVDPSSATSALALLAGFLTVLRGRRSQKRYPSARNANPKTLPTENPNRE